MNIFSKIERGSLFCKDACDSLVKACESGKRLDVAIYSMILFFCMGDFINLALDSVNDKECE